MRSIITFAVRHRVTMLMITLAAVLFGVVSLGRLPMQLLPDISYPTLTVQTEYPDSAPNEVENLITRPLEEAVAVVPGLRRITSVSRAGMSEITLEFGWDTDMDFAALDVREKMDLITLPDESKSPVLLRYDPALDPVIRLGVTGVDNQILLRYLAEQVIKKELESLDGVAAAKVLGGLQEEVHVDLDEQRLAALGIPIATVVQVLGSENVNAAGGRLRDRDSQYLVRTLNQFETPEDVAETILFHNDERTVKLGDVAAVTQAWKEREIVSRLDGKPSVEVAIYKEGDANLVEVARNIRGQIEPLRKQLPPGVNIQVLSDQATFIKSAVRQVQSNAMLGGLLAILVLLVFLRDVRSTAIIALAIPTSIVTTFVLMYKQGVSLNVMSLGGLALGVGMLVDNSIVVLESIVRRRRMGGKPLAELVIDGTDEVGTAVTASTLTTVAVFLPILFVEGIARQIFKDQALTVTYALLVSLVVSLTLTPMLAALGKGTRATRRIWWNPGTWFARSSTAVVTEVADGVAIDEGGRVMSAIRSAYARLLEAALHRRAATVLAAAALFVAAWFGGKGLGADLIPSLNQGEFRFAVEFPEGTPIEHTDVVMRRVEDAVKALPQVATVYCNVGVDAREGGSIQSKKENAAELNVTLRGSARGENETAALEEVRKTLESFEGVTSSLRLPTYFTFKTPVAVEVFGYDLATLGEVSDKVSEALGRVPGLEDITTSLRPGSPEVQIRFDREKLKAAGVDLQQASQTLRAGILGRVATDYKERDRQIDVLVRSGDAQELTFNELPAMVVGYHDALPVRLAAVAEVDVERGPAEILRVSQSRAAVVSANLVGRDLGTVSRDIEAEIRKIPLPPDMSMDLAGQNEEMQSGMRSLLFAVAMAIFMVYIVMASQFESLLDPFLILFSVPMAMIGAVGMLLVTGTPVSVVVMIGGIMLAGIVVNNGIVLVDLIGQLHRGGLAVRDAIVQAGQIRLRPILMTTITTVLGLTPMALGHGEGAEIGRPLAVTVIGGLSVSTLLTLVVIPVLYSLAHRDRPAPAEA